MFIWLKTKSLGFLSSGSFFWTLVVYVSLLFLSSCTSFPGSEYLQKTQQNNIPVGQVAGDLAKCAEPDHQGLPECYCHALSIARYPEREASCQPSKSSRNQTESTYLVGSCENPNMALQSLTSLTERKEVFCSFLGNWNRSSCYCYSSVVAKNPERETYCQSIEKAQLSHDLVPYRDRTIDWVQAMRQHTYWTEEKVTDLTELWSENSDAYLNHFPVKDDCDSVDALLGLAFVLGGFELFELSKVLVDMNLNDDVIADHFVGAIWVSDNWYYIEAGSSDVRPLSDLGFESFLNISDTGSHRIVAHRRLDETEWYVGGPPSMNELAGYCSVPAELLLTELYP